MNLKSTQELHDALINMGKVVRINTKDGDRFWVEYADRFTGKWKRIR